MRRASRAPVALHISPCSLSRVAHPHSVPCRRAANCLQQLNTKSSEPEVLLKASKALGELAKVEGGNAAVEPLLKQALQRLKTVRRVRRDSVRNAVHAAPPSPPG